ncbi:MarR family winged helix-turn-helix transcriptional regulator [Ruegeria halocynthiae]|uniref:MarR family winged helix-turn-helix transcriptional regulator n=1 Tax=Ruegeria halocynthiae TaxID=985054 RepID=UPI0009DEE7A4|nr:MarR family winged helix-turn-helix transcriptional regulator [Ruegeria halocynthiae]
MAPIPSQSEDALFFGDDQDCISYNRVWFNLIRAHRRLYPRITKALKTCGIKDPIWFEILLEVERAGPEGQPMSALEEKLFVPQYALSRHVTRLEKEGVLRREHIADVRRKQILFLTEKGQGMHARIWPVYWEAIQAEIGPHLNVEDAYKLARLLINLLP